MFIGFEKELWKKIGLSQQEICAIFYYKELIVSPGFIKEEKKKMEKLKGKKEETEEDGEEEICTICWHNTVEKTSDLLREYEIFIDEKLIREKNWITPYFIYSFQPKEFGDKLGPSEMWALQKKISMLKQIHVQHLNRLK
mmetsp:Transcript_8093/g.12811  ORF Transcript_8093/g.12811 Transcript_8093/m.12811 type:complete len:140 (-) Transcript_8093:67-486(-)